MINATQQNLYSFEEYITYDDNSDNQYELVDGRLEIVTPPTFLHILICDMIRPAFLTNLAIAIAESLMSYAVEPA